MAGCVYATQNRYPVVLAPLPPVGRHEPGVPARRRGEEGLPVPWTRVHPGRDAKRVVDEITGLVISQRWLCGLKDWRFNSEEDQVLYRDAKVFGAVRPDAPLSLPLDSVDEGFGMAGEYLDNP